MLRIVSGIIAVFAVALASMADAPPAEAQAKGCKKVGISFACRNRGSGKTVMPCRGGETEAQCCARWKKRANDPRRGWCTGRSGGVASFKCACAKKKGGKRPEADASIRRVSPDTIDPASAAESQSGTARSRAGTVLEEIEVEKEVDRTSVPLVQGGADRGAAAKACRKVKYAFVCRRGGGKASGTARCKRGENARACCARVRKLANNTCKRHGGVAKFKCTCARPDGARPGGLLAPGGQGSARSGRSRIGVVVDDDHAGPVPATTGMKRTACKQAGFTYRCRRGDPQRSGRRTCARNQTEAECCSHAQAVVARECGAAPSRWKCRCAN